MARKSRSTTDADCAVPTPGDATNKAAKASRGPKITKRARLTELLATPAGTSIGEIGSALAWQLHTVRAALSALRKAGATIERTAPLSAGDAARYRLLPNSEEGK